MLAELVGVPVRTVRRFHRAGLLEPASVVMQLPHFDYSGLATARQLAGWLEQGATVHSIQAQLESLRHRMGNQLSLEQLPITADGEKLVLRDGDRYVEATGQLRFGFEDAGAALSRPATLRFHPPHETSPPTPDDAGQTPSLDAVIDMAIVAEDEGDLETAVRWYRCALTTYGPNADICFQIAELLYRLGDVTGARERYFMALELNPDLLEARANLGCVLAESGQLDLAVAAFEGALQQFADYADVHFHLARLLDEQGQTTKAAEHWQRFVELSPASPWAEEAQCRLQHHLPMLEF